ncbi:N-acetylglutamate synthase [Xylariomycetidae sp. FL2044]|nr:N-acetylglutamate synthase [Xylariomycetidae sp. FL2044]
MAMRHTVRKASLSLKKKKTSFTKEADRTYSTGLTQASNQLSHQSDQKSSGPGKPVTFTNPYASISESQRQKKSNDRDFLVSVLETSVTKRDAKAYMNKFVPLLERKGATDFKQRAVQTRSNGKTQPAESSSSLPSRTDAVVNPTDNTHGPMSEEGLAIQEPLLVSLVKFRAPQLVNDTTLDGVGKTLSQLRKLGLISIVVLDCRLDDEDEIVQRQVATMQASRIAMAIDKYDSPGARVIDSPITIGHPTDNTTSPFTSQRLFIGNPHDLMSALKDDLVAIIPSFGYTADNCTIKPVEANDAVLALTRQLSGLQFLGQSVEEPRMTRMLRAAEIYRIVVLDPLGGIPAKNRATGRHLFLNLEQEFQEVKDHLTGLEPLGPNNLDSKRPDSLRHLENAELAKNALSLLPPTSSVVITTPQEVAKERGPDEHEMDVALVGTRRGQNPLIHSLLTDKPVQSSSLPMERFTPVASSTGPSRIGSLTTLAKRGMPLTVFPDPRTSPWKPPQRGQSCLNLTDPCIDLPRLVNLIEDSFGRKLDIDHYLRRINGNLAGVIVAGEYEGGALLTWEKPPGLNDDGSDEASRLVPYLDKFAVLRKSQGAGGVADIVFNAMVRDCFPEGVCWRSRKDNPVNKWYFERSRGSLKIPDMNWTMFWTTPDLALEGQKFRDYESVCRGVEPSWADKKHVVD